MYFFSVSPTRTWVHSWCIVGIYWIFIKYPIYKNLNIYWTQFSCWAEFPLSWMHFFSLYWSHQSRSSPALLFEEHICSLKWFPIVILWFTSTELKGLVSSGNLISCSSKFIVGESCHHRDPCLPPAETCNILLSMQFDPKIAEASYEEDSKLRDEKLSTNRRAMRWLVGLYGISQTPRFIVSISPYWHRVFRLSGLLGNSPVESCPSTALSFV